MKIYNLGIPNLYIGEDPEIEGHNRRPEIEEHRKAVNLSACAHGMRQDEYVQLLQTVCHNNLFVVHDSNKMRTQNMTCATAPFIQFLTSINFPNTVEFSCPFFTRDDQNNWIAYRGMGGGFIVFEKGGVERYLEYYGDAKVPVMLVGFGQSDRAELDRLWSNYLTGPEGYPKTKVGILDINSIPIITRYPWDTVITRLAVATASAAILSPNGTKIPIVDGHASENRLDAHFDTLADDVRASLVHSFETAGYNEDQLRLSKIERIAWNLSIMCDYENRGTETFVSAGSGGLF